MQKLLKPVSGAFFWAGVIMITYLSCFLILISYDLIIIKAVAAAEVSSATVYQRPAVADDLAGADTNRTDFINCDCEKEFVSPVTVTWRGKVNSVFLSGEGIGVEKYNYDEEYGMFYVITNSLYKDEVKEIEVRGELVGITCAYANTIFGQCVPLIDAKEIKNIGSY